MSRVTVVLASRAQREQASRWCLNAPVNTRIEFRESKRTPPQNDRFWACLTEIQRQRPVHNGVKMSTHLWKAVFMQAAGHEVVMLPTLEGDGFFPMGHRSSELSVGEMSELMEFMGAWCAREGIDLAEPEARAA